VQKYFLLSVSTKENLDLCRKFALAGVPNSGPGVWAYSEISQGDFVSLLYGAKAHDLYQVKTKYALRNADSIGPWPHLISRLSGRSYCFPFRFELEVVREFEESLVRTEFAYVAENLLLRGGYRKTHFQADQTTLQNASQMGVLREKRDSYFEIGASKGDRFEPKFVKKKSEIKPPEVYQFNELILQAAIRSHLSEHGKLKRFLDVVAPTLDPKGLEVLGERALPEGHLDVLVKQAVPIGQSKKIAIEVKAHSAPLASVKQLSGYKNELGKECLAAVLIAETFGPKVKSEAAVHQLRSATYDLRWNAAPRMTFADIEVKLNISVSPI
jgi:hypothetical protein